MAKKTNKQEEDAIAAFAMQNDVTEDNIEDAVVEDVEETETQPMRASLAPTHGYSLIDKEELPFEGRQYPESMQFEVRPASVAEIRHWSSIDDTQNPRKIYDYFSDIVEKCVNVKNGHHSDIKECDRLWFVFKIHELTFVEAERPALIKCNCPNCKTEWNAKIDVNTLQYDLPTVDLKYLNKATGAFDIKTKSYGDITLSIPSLYTANAALTYMQSKDPQWLEDNKAFLELAMFLVPVNAKASDKTFNDIYVQWRSWTPKQLALMIALVEKCKLAVKQSIKIKCPKCNNESDQAIDLEGGIRSLFLPISDIADELL